MKNYIGIMLCLFLAINLKAAPEVGVVDRAPADTGGDTTGRTGMESGTGGSTESGASTGAKATEGTTTSTPPDYYTKLIQDAHVSTSDLVGSLSIVIQSKGGARLSATEKTTLNNLITTARSTHDWNTFNADFHQALQNIEGGSVDISKVDTALQLAEQSNAFDKFFNTVDSYFSKAVVKVGDVFKKMADTLGISSSSSSNGASSQGAEINPFNNQPSGTASSDSGAASGTASSGDTSATAHDTGANATGFSSANPFGDASASSAAPVNLTPASKGSSKSVFSDIPFDPNPPTAELEQLASELGMSTTEIQSLDAYSLHTSLLLERLVGTTEAPITDPSKFGPNSMNLLGITPPIDPGKLSATAKTNMATQIGKQADNLINSLSVSKYETLTSNPDALAAVNNFLSRCSFPKLDAENFSLLAPTAQELVTHLQQASIQYINS